MKILKFPELLEKTMFMTGRYKQAVIDEGILRVLNKL